MPNPDPTFVYRFFDANDRLIYVGLTCEPAVRWKDHAKFKAWWSDVVRIAANLYPSREQAQDEELRAIREEAPLRNVKDAVRAARTQSRPRPLIGGGDSGGIEEAMRLHFGHDRSLVQGFKVGRFLGLTRVELADAVAAGTLRATTPPGMRGLWYFREDVKLLRLASA